ncbi:MULTISPECIES: mycofactocin precursor MftA [Streptacidiphilus]|uniref:Mycofactocin MftA n=2 Tax=Streptacidiphilus TaxID=228398 RepID=A0ABV6UUR9_9ACTN|nr:mycofactocin precursor MftA [Streptacidiphilus jeojiense]
MDQSVTTQSQDLHRTEADTAPVATDELIEADDLVEEVSIDGMCGVY